MVILWRVRSISCWLQVERITEIALDKWMVFETFKCECKGAFLDEIATPLTLCNRIGWHGFVDGFPGSESFTRVVSMKYGISWVEGSPSLVRGTWGIALFWKLCDKFGYVSRFFFNNRLFLYTECLFPVLCQVPLDRDGLEVVLKALGLFSPSWCPLLKIPLCCFYLVNGFG